MPSDSRIQIKFKSFELEESRDCEFDYIEVSHKVGKFADFMQRYFFKIFEGTSDKDPKVNRFCGNSIPPSYTSLGNALLIVFKSDWSANFEGFRISYEIGKKLVKISGHI